MDPILLPDSDQGNGIGLRLLKLLGCFTKKAVKAPRYTNNRVFGGAPTNNSEIMSFATPQINDITWVASKCSIVLIKLEYSFVDNEGLIFNGVRVRRWPFPGRVAERHDAHRVVRLIRLDDHVARSERIHYSLGPIAGAFTDKHVVRSDHKVTENNPSLGSG
jgi:hypothetical protein